MKNLAISAVVFPTLVMLVTLAQERGLAAPLDPAHVSADAKWVIHLDFEALRESQLADAFSEKRPDRVKRFRQMLRDRYGIEAEEDLKGATLFGDAYRTHSGAAILRARYDREKVEAEVLEQPGIKSSHWGDYTLYTWRVRTHGRTHRHRHAEEGRHDTERGEAGRRAAEHKGRTVTAVLVDDETVVFAGSEEGAKAAVRLLQGKVQSLEGTDSRLLFDAPEGTFLYGAAIELQDIARHQRPFPVLQQHEHATLVIGERDGKLFKDVKLQARDEETAGQMETALEGLVALSKVITTEIESLNALYDDVEVSRDGAVVNYQWRGATNDVVEAAEDVRQHLRQRRDAR